MPGLLDNHGRELAADNIATLRTRMLTVREAAAKLVTEAEGIAKELGVSQADRDSVAGPRPDSIIGRLGVLRLARLRANSDKPSAEELRLAARHDVLESALVTLRREGLDASATARDAQDRFEHAVGQFNRDYPSQPATFRYDADRLAMVVVP